MTAYLSTKDTWLYNKIIVKCKFCCWNLAFYLFNVFNTLLTVVYFMALIYVSMIACAKFSWLKRFI